MLAETGDTRELRDIKSALALVLEDMGQQSAALSAVRNEMRPRYVINVASGKYHSTPSFMARSHPSEWRAMCNWKFGAKPGCFDWKAELPRELASHLRCYRCFGS